MDFYYFYKDLMSNPEFVTVLVLGLGLLLFLYSGQFIMNCIKPEPKKMSCYRVAISPNVQDAIREELEESLDCWGMVQDCKEYGFPARIKIPSARFGQFITFTIDNNLNLQNVDGVYHMRQVAVLSPVSDFMYPN